MDRRQFAKRITTGTLALGAGVASAQEGGRERPRPPRPQPVVDGAPPFDERKHVRTSGKVEGEWFEEAPRKIPVRSGYDVIVVGGGPAGFAAALAAARRGAKTALLEVHGCIGGVWTSGLLSWILDSFNKEGIMAELLKRLEERGNGHRMKSAWVYHPEPMKLLLEDMLTEAGVEIHLFTRVVGASVGENKQISAVLTESKSGREAWLAKTFIDASGDGDLAAQAGCGFDYGSPLDGSLQPMSLLALVHGLKTDEIAPFVNHVATERGLGSGKMNLLAELRSAGVDPSYAGPSLFEIHDGLYTLMANHQYKVSAIDADEVTRATLEGRRENHAMIDALRKKGGPWKNVEILCTAEQIGTREARRIHGRYTVSDDDIRTGARFDDGICHVKFGIDVHSTNPDKTKAIEDKPFRSKSYDVPLRSLMAKDLDGLVIAGRCISGGFLAHSSYRVTGNSVAMGEAAGVVCATAVKNKVLPHEVPFSELGAS